MPKTNFRPDVNGFAFSNRWEIDPAEVENVRIALRGATSFARTALIFFQASPLTWLTIRRTRDKLNAWIDEASIQAYGLCGGMAFAALDYYARPDIKFPRGKGIEARPSPGDTRGKPLRAYLFKRLLDSLADNVPTFLVWMAFLHIIPDNPIFGGGPRWLARQSASQWEKLKGYIDVDKAWPIGLVGTTTDPTHNHQVVACGYDDPGDGTGVIYIYDMNHPEAEQAIQITFGDQMLEAKEKFTDNRGELRGFFCERYTPRLDPPAVAWP